MRTVYLMNSPIITAEGDYRYLRITPATAAAIAATSTLVSAVGHTATAAAMSAVLDIPVECIRREIVMDAGDAAIVYRPKARLAEGQVLSDQELRAIPCELGLLERLR